MRSFGSSKPICNLTKCSSFANFKYYSGASGLMGLKIKSKNKNSVIKFVNSLKLFGYGYSWGGFESLALYQDKREQGNRKYLKLAKDEHLVRLQIELLRYPDHF